MSSANSNTQPSYKTTVQGDKNTVLTVAHANNSTFIGKQVVYTSPEKTLLHLSGVLLEAALLGIFLHNSHEQLREMLQMYQPYLPSAIIERVSSVSYVGWDGRNQKTVIIVYGIDRSLHRSVSLPDTNMPTQSHLPVVLHVDERSINPTVTYTYADTYGITTTSDRHLHIHDDITNAEIRASTQILPNNQMFQPATLNDVKQIALYLEEIERDIRPDISLSMTSQTPLVSNIVDELSTGEDSAVFDWLSKTIQQVTESCDWTNPNHSFDPFSPERLSTPTPDGVIPTEITNDGNNTYINRSVFDGLIDEDNLLT